MKNLHIGQLSLPYEIDWSKKRSSVGLQLDQNKTLRIKAPSSATLEEIDGILERKKPWILRKLNGIDRQEKSPIEKEFYSGEKLYYKGRRYRLDIEQKNDSKWPDVKLIDGKFRIITPKYSNESERKINVKQALVSWYEDKARDHLLARAKKYALKMDVEPAKVEIISSEIKWGKTDQGCIYLNWRLILAPVRIQDYVIVHELAHLKYETHSRSFWNTVGSLIPDYEDRREWLRINGNLLRI